MPAGLTHKIQKQVLRLTLDAEKDAFQKQEAFKSAFYSKVLPGFQTIFDRYAGEDIIIRLDQLHLELDDIDLDKLDTEFPDKALKALEAQLEKLITKARLNQAPEVKLVPAATGRLELVLFFLKFGCLPWWAHQTDDDPRTALKTLLDQEPELILPALRRILTGDPVQAASVLKRLIQQFPEALVLEVLYRLPEPEAPVLEVIGRAILAILRSGPVIAGLSKTQLLSHVFHMALAPPPALRKQPAGLPLAQFNPAAMDALLEAVLGGPVRQQLTEGQITVLRSILEKSETLPADSQVLIRNILEAWEKPALQAPNPDPQKEAPESSPSEEPDSEAAPDKNQKERSPGPPWKIEAEKIYVENAGMVILGGFLEPFFEKLGLLDTSNKAAFNNTEAHQQAIFMLDYLVYGINPVENPEEHLILNKILCNWPLTEPLPAELHLPESFTQEADLLLATIIDYWKVLGKIANTDLQQSFFQRSGSLQNKDADWHLQVEQKTLDVMLDQLPWSFRYLKLPWMNVSLEVEW